VCCWLQGGRGVITHPNDRFRQQPLRAKVPNDRSRQGRKVTSGMKRLSAVDKARVQFPA
jgi:hypothetical protein